MATNYFQKKRFRENRDGYLFLLPAVFAFTIFLAIPLLMTFGIVFTDYKLIGHSQFVGFQNFIRLSIDSLFKQALGNTVRFLLILTLIHCVLSLALAYAVFHVRQLRFLYRSIIFFPTTVTTASVAMAWVYMFATDTGFINFYIRQLGGSNIPWMTNPVMIYVTIGLFSAWKFIGTSFLFYYIGLQNIPASYHEAAMIDGANKIQTFFRITLPLLTPTVFFVLVTNIIYIFQIFEEPYFIAGSNTYAMSMALLVYQNAFINMRFGYASLLAIIMFLIMMIITVILIWSQKRWVNYDYE